MLQRLSRRCRDRTGIRPVGQFTALDRSGKGGQRPDRGDELLFGNASHVLDRQVEDRNRCRDHVGRSLLLQAHRSRSPGMQKGGHRAMPPYPLFPSCECSTLRRSPSQAKCPGLQHPACAPSACGHPWRTRIGAGAAKPRLKPQLPLPCASRSRSIRRHSATLRLCSLRVRAKACPPVPSATKKM